MAPDVTITTSTPAACSAATSSQTRAMTDTRSAPSSWATIEDPSLTTATGMATAPLEAGIELEHDPPDLDVVARLEAGPLERGDPPHARQPALHVGRGLLVVHVPARDQPLDGVA